MNKSLVFAFSALLLVTACSSREDADRKLAKGCEAGVRVLLAKDTSDRQIDKIKSKSFTNDGKIRIVTLATSVKNKVYGYEADETFTCRFTEDYGVGFMGWQAAIQQIKMGETIFGKDDSGTLQGGLQDYMNLTGDVDDAMK